MDVNTQNMNNSIGTNSGPVPVQPAAPAPETDISKTTITILVLLTLMISVIGTWTVLNEISSVHVAKQQPSIASGQIQLNIQPPSTPKTSEATGNLMLEIKKPV